MNYENINIDILQNKTNDCKTSCKLVLKNLKNSSELNKTNLECNADSTNCFINFGIIAKDSLNPDSSTKYNFNSVRIIKNSNIKIDNFKNSELYFYLIFEGKNNLHLFIPIVNDDKSTKNIDEFLNNSNSIKIENLYDKVFPDKHSFYFFENKNDYIIIFDNTKKINNVDYMKLKDLLGQSDTFLSGSEKINPSNIFYSDKSNCLYENIDLSMQDMRNYIEKITNNSEESEPNQTINLKDNTLETGDIWKNYIIQGIILFLTFPFLLKKIISSNSKSIFFVVIIVSIIIFILSLLKESSIFFENTDSLPLSISSFILFIYLLFKSNNFLDEEIISFISILLCFINAAGIIYFAFNVEYFRNNYNILKIIIPLIIITVIFVLFRAVFKNVKYENYIFYFLIIILFYSFFINPIYLFDKTNILNRNNNPSYVTLLTLLLIFYYFVIVNFSSNSENNSIKEFGKYFNFNLMFPKGWDKSILLSGIIILCLITGIIFNFLKLDNTKLYKTITIKKSLSQPFENYNNEKNKELAKLNINFKKINGDTDEYDLFQIEYEEKNDNIINQIKQYIDKYNDKYNENESDNKIQNYIMNDYENNTILDYFYNKPIFIIIKIILLIFTVISIFIKNSKLDNILFVFIIIFLIYSVFGLYFQDKNTLSLIISIIILVLYFIVFIVKIILIKSNEEQISFLGKVNLYVLLSLISLLFLTFISKIKNPKSSNMFILILSGLIVLSSFLFYFTNVKNNLMDRKRNNIYVSRGNHNNAFDEFVENNRKRTLQNIKESKEKNKKIKEIKEAKKAELNQKTKEARKKTIKSLSDKLSSVQDSKKNTKKTFVSNNQLLSEIKGTKKNTQTSNQPRNQQSNINSQSLLDLIEYQLKNLENKDFTNKQISDIKSKVNKLKTQEGKNSKFFKSGESYLSRQYPQFKDLIF